MLPPVWQVTRALLVAATIWGLPVGTPTPPIVFEHFPREVLGEYRSGPNVIAVNSNRHWRWNKLCTTVAHEMGHYVGRRHSRNPHALMYPRYHPERRCRDFGRPYLRSKGRLP